MSGHSKFANIKHKKEKNDAAKGKIFTIIGREIAVAVKEGDKVQSGQTIGAVGDSAECEAALPSHLHFALKRNGEWIDPIDHIAPIGK